MKYSSIVRVLWAAPFFAPFALAQAPAQETPPTPTNAPVVVAAAPLIDPQFVGIEPYSSISEEARMQIKDRADDFLARIKGEVFADCSGHALIASVNESFVLDEYPAEAFGNPAMLARSQRLSFLVMPVQADENQVLFESPITEELKAANSTLGENLSLYILLQLEQTDGPEILTVQKIVRNAQTANKAVFEIGRYQSSPLLKCRVNAAAGKGISHENFGIKLEVKKLAELEELVGTATVEAHADALKILLDGLRGNSLSGETIDSIRKQQAAVRVQILEAETKVKFHKTQIEGLNEAHTNLTQRLEALKPKRENVKAEIKKIDDTKQENMRSWLDLMQRWSRKVKEAQTQVKNSDPEFLAAAKAAGDALDIYLNPGFLRETFGNAEARATEKESTKKIRDDLFARKVEALALDEFNAHQLARKTDEEYQASSEPRLKELLNESSKLQTQIIIDETDLSVNTQLTKRLEPVLDEETKKRNELRTRDVNLETNVKTAVAEIVASAKTAPIEGQTSILTVEAPTPDGEWDATLKKLESSFKPETMTAFILSARDSNDLRIITQGLLTFGINPINGRQEIHLTSEFKGLDLTPLTHLPLYWIPGSTASAPKTWVNLRTLTTDYAGSAQSMADFLKDKKLLIELKDGPLMIQALKRLGLSTDSDSSSLGAISVNYVPELDEELPLSHPTKAPSEDSLSEFFGGNLPTALKTRLTQSLTPNGVVLSSVPLTLLEEDFSDLVFQEVVKIARRKLPPVPGAELERAMLEGRISFLKNEKKMTFERVVIQFNRGAGKADETPLSDEFRHTCQEIFDKS